METAARTQPIAQLNRDEERGNRFYSVLRDNNILRTEQLKLDLWTRTQRGDTAVTTMKRIVPPANWIADQNYGVFDARRVSGGLLRRIVCCMFQFIASVTASIVL